MEWTKVKLAWRIYDGDCESSLDEWFLCLVFAYYDLVYRIVDLLFS